ncbi:MAG: D-alanyl-D-alanine carboxypeptidase, partial [Vallitaleaceae bacterium]|nr:D-alanyl-D-alanine carboxypeptidase [Vallitaleaceae bacterium]
MRKILSLMIALIILLCAIFSTPIHALEDREIIAQSAILMDKVTGRVLWEKNSQKKMAMASTTKIMTCIVALENAPLDLEIKVSHKAASAPKVKLYIKEGETYLLGDLLYALMLVSSNDVAVAIAEGVSGSVDDFCKLMTEKAVALGAKSTSYKTPNGLDAKDHYTTAYDLALITQYALDNEAFNKIINTKTYSFFDLKNARSFTVNNKNAFLNMYEGANGVKTGFTGDAGYCFVGSVKQQQMELIAVVLACGWYPNKTFKWRDTIALMDYGFENFKYLDLKINNQVVGGLSGLTYGKTDFVEGVMSCDFHMILQNEEHVRIIYEMKPITQAPIHKGQVIGYAHIYVDDNLYNTVNITSVQSVERIDLKYC